MKWNYTSKSKSSTGYEDILDELKRFKKEDYVQMKEEEKKDVVNRIFNLYREKNIFPITYYNEDGIRQEIQKAIDKDVEFEGDVLNLKYNQGSSLCKFLFQNLHSVECNGDKRTMYNKFYEDHLLKRSIDFSLRFKKSVTPSELRSSMEMIGGTVATNFKAMNAKALYEKYTPENGIIYDFACGFGGRMLGALSSKNNYKYFGVEPNTETFANLNKLGSYIEDVTKRKDTYKIFCKGSEDLNLKRTEFVDFAFSSPPYFTLEKYCEEDTQCYIKFPTLEEWFDGYVKPTIEKIYEMLKHDRYYAVNIADFNVGNKRIEYVDEWIKMSKKAGFTYDRQIDMKLKKRVGDGHESKEDKREGIFVFYKK